MGIHKSEAGGSLVIGEQLASSEMRLPFSCFFIATGSRPRQLHAHVGWHCHWVDSIKFAPFPES